MKSNTLLFSSLEANSKVSTHCSNLMIGRKKKKEFWRNYSRSRNGFRESLLQIAPKINIIMEHVSFPQRFSIKTWKPKILWAKPKNLSVPSGQKPGRFLVCFSLFFSNKKQDFLLQEKPQIYWNRLWSLQVLFIISSVLAGGHRSVCFSQTQLQNFWYSTKHGNVSTSHFYCLLPNGGQLSVR